MDAFSSMVSTVVAGLGLLATSPMGNIDPPRVAFSDLERSRHAYVADVRLPDGRSVGRISSQGPLSTPTELLPDIFLRAVIAVEDRRFGSHPGVDPRGLAAASLSTLRGRTRGGSGIAQQMVKNAWIGPEQSWERKLVEAMVAIRATAGLGEAAVLRAYLENAWFGRGVTGAAGAAEAWFGREWSELSTGEMAFLVGILRGPGWYDPERHPQRALERRNLVLSIMKDQGLIDEQEFERETAAPLHVTPARDRSPDASAQWLMSAARPEVLREIRDSAAGAGLLSRVEVTVQIDPIWQAIAQEEVTRQAIAIGGLAPLARLPGDLLARLRETPSPELARQAARDHVEGTIPWSRGNRSVAVISGQGPEWTLLFDTGRIETVAASVERGLDVSAGDVLLLSETDGELRLGGRPGVEGAAILIDPSTGALIASIGGASPETSAFDRTLSMRQPGSAVKAFLWLAALENGYLPGTPVPDIEQTWATAPGVTWTPRNYGGRQSGMIALSSAFTQSSNLVAAALVNSIGVDEMARVAELSGAYPDGMQRHPTAALGAIETSLRSLTEGYATIMNAGVPRQTTIIRDLHVEGHPRVEDGMRVGELRSGGGPVARRSSVEDMLGMLRGVITSGTGSEAFRGHPVTVAGKTGTTQSYRDAVFIGLTPHLAIGVWFGRDDNTSLPGRASGGRTAAPVAAEILRRAHDSGLIDADGLRDPGRLPSMPWPAATTPASAPAAPRQPQAAPPHDGFWGVVGETQGSPANDFRQPDRNADLLPGSWR